MFLLSLDSEMDGILAGRQAVCVTLPVSDVMDEDADEMTAGDSW